MSTGPGVLEEVADALFSAGIRSDGSPRRRAESHFAFADRVRQPYFERERRWHEDAFSHYPDRHDRGDLRARFRKSDDVQHGAAAWELYVHELWRRMGWTLSPHPDSPDGRRRDFHVARGDQQFILECAVDNPSAQQAGAERRWEEIWAQLKALKRPSHHVSIHRDAIGDGALRIGPLVAEARRNLDALEPAEGALLLQVDTPDGWKFRIEARPGPLAGLVTYGHGGTMTMEDRLYNPVRNRVHEKSKGSSSLALPYVLALQIVNAMPITAVEGAVRGALIGTYTEVLGTDLRRTQLRSNNDGAWYRSGTSRGRGLSALLLHQGRYLGGPLPVLHHHPAPHQQFVVADLPLEQVRYAVDDVEFREDASKRWHELFDEEPGWPGPRILSKASALGQPCRRPSPGLRRVPVTRLTRRAACSDDDVAPQTCHPRRWCPDYVTCRRATVTPCTRDPWETWLVAA